MEKLENFRNNLRELTSIRGMKSALAKKAGISPVYFSYILAGSKTPSLEIAVNIAASANIPLSDLLGNPSDFRKKFKSNLLATSR